MKTLLSAFLLLALTACNKPPEVKDIPAVSAWERDSITIKLQASDPDEDPLHWNWKQISGGSVKSIEGNHSPILRITLPEQKEDEEFLFRASVSDGDETTTRNVRIVSRAYKKLDQLEFTDPALARCVRDRFYHLIWHDMGNAKELHCARQNIQNLSGLAQLPNLEKLDLRGNNINDISSLKKLYALEYVNLSDNKIKQTSPLNRLNNLQWLALSRNPLESLGFINTLPMLTELHLSNAHLTDQDISILRSTGKVQVLYLNNNQLRNAAPLGKLRHLSELYLNGNQLNSIQGLDQLDGLKKLYLDGGNGGIPCSQVTTIVKKSKESVVISPEHCKV